MKEEKLAILAEHYKFTLGNIKKDITQRDKYFIYLILSFLGLMTQIADLDLLSIIVNKLLSIDISKLDNQFISSLVGAITLFVFIKYSQVHTTIERSYAYIKEVELEVNKVYKGKLFLLESKFYAAEKSYIKNSNKIIFKYIFPLLFSSLVAYKIYLFFPLNFTFYNAVSYIIYAALLHHVISFSIKG